MIDWIKSHPWETVAIVTVALSTIANVVIGHYGDGHPRLRRALRFLIDLLSALPMKGSPSRGLQVPGLSVSAPPPAEKQQ